MNIRVSKTKYFDIIYCTRSITTAQAIFERADEIYESISADYGHKIWFRMPVVITPANEVQNAYFSLLYYPRIVIYDTIAGEVTRNSAEPILNVFRHELTHAFTLEMKNPFWQWVDKVFGAVVNPAGITITAGWTEGAAVLSESTVDGVKIQGRLNDGWALQILKQAKIEGVFPKYRDIQGADDKYPLGNYYYFNAFFNMWLVENFGMESYANFWWRCVNLKSITASGAFKKSFGMNLNKAWEAFYDSIDVSDMVNVDKKDDVLGMGTKGFVATSLVESEDGFAFIEQKTNSVYWVEYDIDRIENEVLQNPELMDNPPKYLKKPKKLFTLLNVQKISISSDSRFMAVTYISNSGTNRKKKMKVYDMKTHKFHNLDENELQEGTLIRDGHNYFLVAVKFYSQNSTIIVKKMEFNKRGKLEFTNTEAVINRRTYEVYDICDLGHGLFAYVEKEALSWRIIVRTLDERITKTSRFIKIPVDGNIRYLSRDFSGKSDLIYSYATPDSAGIDYPTGNYFIKKFHRESDIYSIKDYEEKYGKISNFVKIHLLNHRAVTEGLSEYQKAWERVTGTEITDVSKKYNPLQYFNKGLFLPVGLFDSYEVDWYKSKFANKVSKFPALGAMYMISNPWEKGVFLATAGYFFDTKTYGGKISYSTGTGTEAFNFSVSSQVEFKNTSFRESRSNLTLSSQIPVLNYSWWLFSNSFTYMRAAHETYKSLDYFMDVVQAGFSNIHKSGPSYYEKAGFQLMGVFQYEMGYSRDLLVNKIENKYQDYSAQFYRFSPQLTVNLPKLIPVVNRDFFTYNLPAKINFSIFPGDYKYLSVDAMVYLFSMEVEKGVPFLPALFFNRFTIFGGYNYSLKDKYITNMNFWDYGENRIHEDSVYAGLTLGFTPNFGQAARKELYMELDAKVNYRLRNLRPGASPLSWSVSFKANFFEGLF